MKKRDLLKEINETLEKMAATEQNLEEPLKAEIKVSKSKRRRRVK